MSRNFTDPVPLLIKLDRLFVALPQIGRNECDTFTHYHASAMFNVQLINRKRSICVNIFLHRDKIGQFDEANNILDMRQEVCRC